MRFYLLILGIFVSGCITVSLDSTKITPSKKINFLEPVGFYLIKSEFADMSWKDKSSNVISYRSECGLKDVLENQEILENNLSGLFQVNILEKSEQMFNNRQSVRAFVKAKLEGVEKQLDILVFSKNFCTYTIMLVGKTDKISEAKESFEHFINNFKVW